MLATFSVRKAIISCLAIIATGLGIFIAYTVRPNVVFSAPNYTPLSFTSVFQVPCPGGMALESVTGSGDSLYFLCFSVGQTPFPTATLMATGTTGTIEHQFTLTGTRDLHLSVDNGGRPILFSRLHPGASIIELASNSQRPIALAGPAEDLVATADGLYRVTSKGVSLFDSNALASVPVDTSEPFVAFSSSPHHIAIVTLLTARLTVLDNHSVVNTTSQLPAPEITGVTRNAAQMEGALFGATSDGMGHIFAVTAPYIASQGAVVAEFSESGTLLNRFRCTLPTISSAETKGNPFGYLTPWGVVVTNGSLFLVDAHEKTVAMYLIPSS